MENLNGSFENEQQVELQDYLRILYRGRWIILLSFLVVLVATAVFTFTTDPVYEAKATVMVEEDKSFQEEIFNVGYVASQSTAINNQIEILKSRSLADRVILALETAPHRDSLTIFQPNSNGIYLTKRQQVNWVMRHLVVNPKPDSDVIEITFSAGSAFEAAEICNAIANSFQRLNKEFKLSDFKELRLFLENQLNKKSEELKKSEEVLKLYQEDEKLVSLDDHTKELINHLSKAQAELETSVITLEADQEQKHNLERQLDERKELLSEEVSQVSSPVLVQLQQDYARMVSEKVKYESLIAQERSIDPKVYQLELQNQANRIRAVQRRLEEEAQRIANSSMVSDPLAVAQELLQSILAVETRIQGHSAKINALREVVSQYERELELLPGQGLALARLERQVKVDQNIYILLTQKLEETKITAAGQKEIIRVMDSAIEPQNPVSPQKRRNLLLGAILGLGLGIGITFLLEFLDDSIKNPDILEKMGFPILAIIPEIPSKELAKSISATNGHHPKEFNMSQEFESRLITHLDPKSPVSEAYRTLRTNIQFQNMKKNGTALLVTSSTPKEGKSTTFSNLAITMAQMGTKTLLVDTDLRRPVVHSIFKLNKDKGITNFLAGKSDFNEIVKPSLIDNLFVVTSGPLPPNPSELLASDDMDRFIEKARSEFDLILFDSPPVIAVTDAAILTTKLDGTILVIKAHQTQKNAIQRAKMLMDNVNAQIVGCVLNSVNIQKAYGSSYYYYYYHYYSYYGHDLKRSKFSSSKPYS